MRFARILILAALRNSGMGRYPMHPWRLMFDTVTYHIPARAKRHITGSRGSQNGAVLLGRILRAMP